MTAADAGCVVEAAETADVAKAEEVADVEVEADAADASTVPEAPAADRGLPVGDRSSTDTVAVRPAIIRKSAGTSSSATRTGIR